MARTASNRGKQSLQVLAETLFELRLYGGRAERDYRGARQGIEQLPWEALSTSDYSEAERVAARREWTEAAFSEYVSAAGTSLLVRALVRARVPLDLSAMAAQFPLDELFHAELCSRMANVLGGGTPLSY